MKFQPVDAQQMHDLDQVPPRLWTVPKQPPEPTPPETEADGLHAGALRRLKARHQSQAFRDQSKALSKPQSDTPPKTE